jgi:histidine kinase/DNA gyrase B/HSP90-like ATPase
VNASPPKSTGWCPVVATQTFIAAIRDSGYKGTSWAVAELLDNAIEASATVVDVSILEGPGTDERTVIVTDNGSGMHHELMQVALQFGGSTRFNSRQGLGRYGMGLPCSALSQARRVDLYSWQEQGHVWWTYLDMDEIVEKRQDFVPAARQVPATSLPYKVQSQTGTVAVLTKCDRLEYKRTSALIAKLRYELGRIFRGMLARGIVLRLSGASIDAVDPLFITGSGLTGAKAFGPPLELQIRVPGASASSTVTVSFSELPVDTWHSLSNRTKRQQTISKGAGVSIVRAGREIDHGWYFMGDKRRENYDDWWRCQIEFEPVLDELFGVTHTKQRINPTDALNEILTPHIEAAAHALNARVRRAFTALREQMCITGASKRAEHTDGLLEPPSGLSLALRAPSPDSLRVRGLRYRIRRRELSEQLFIEPALLRSGCLQLDINVRHAFFETVYEPMSKRDGEGMHALRSIELLLLAFARAECTLRNRRDRAAARRLREKWSRALAAFLG